MDSPRHALELTDDAVLEICCRQLQRLNRKRGDGHQVRRAQEGGATQVWLVDNDLVLRALPWRRDHRIAHVDAQERIRAIPAVEHMIPKLVSAWDDGGQGFLYHLEERVRGTSLETAAATQRTAADLAAFLSALRSQPLDVKWAQDLPTHPQPDLARQERMANAAWDQLATTGQLHLGQDEAGHVVYPATRLALPWNRHGRSDPQRPRQVVLHGDLKGEHILVDAGDGAIAGIVDWADMCVGDAAVDIEGVCVAVGAAMAGQVGVAAGYDAVLVARGIALARCNAVLRLDDRLNGDDDDSPVELLRSQLRRALQHAPGFDAAEADGDVLGQMQRRCAE